MYETDHHGTSALASDQRVPGSVVQARSDDKAKRRVEQATGLPFAFDLAVA
jgi:hypothetical protein